VIEYQPELYNMRLLRSLHSEKMVGVHWEVLASLFELTETTGRKYLVRGVAALELLPGKMGGVAVCARTGDYVFDDESEAASALERVAGAMATLRVSLMEQLGPADYTVTGATQGGERGSK